jgi:regulatory protein
MNQRKPKLLDAEALWQYAVRALGGRAHSSGELREKLRRKAERMGDIDGVISRLKDAGYLDDRRYAESFAAARLSGEKFGSSRVTRDLRQRRVAPALAEQTVKQVFADVDEKDLIEEWIRKKYRTAEREGLFHDQKDLAAAYRRLLHAGFRSGDILRVLKRFAANPDLLDGVEMPDPAAEEFS